MCRTQSKEVNSMGIQAPALPFAVLRCIPIPCGACLFICLMGIVMVERIERGSLYRAMDLHKVSAQ